VSSSKAETLRRLHHEPPILVLPNVWDVATARIFERLGAPAIATSSAAVAWALGYPDGEAIPQREMLDWVARIARAVDLPVTADLEAGYGDPGGTARAALEAGAVGLNLEDANVPLEQHVEAVRAVRAAAPEIVVNARTDVFLDGDRDFDDAVRRANAYLEAGADCAFVPGVADAETIGRLVEAIDGPVNILATKGCPPVAELERLGVARVSVGSGIGRGTYRHAERLARQVLEQGTYGYVDDEFGYADLNAILEA